MHYELFQDPGYSPRLVLSDFRLFSHLIKCIRGKQLLSNEEVIAVGKRISTDSHFRDGIRKA